MASTSTKYIEVSEGNRFERSGSSDSTFEDFEQTILHCSRRKWKNFRLKFNTHWKKFKQ